MIRKSLISLGLLIVALATNGAGAAAAIGEPGETGEELREEFHQTYPLSPTGRISLENINGGVQIKVWDQASVQVDAIKKAYKQNRLNEAKIEVNATQENIRIKTEYPDENQNFRSDERRYDNPATVEYTLTVPRKAILESIEMVNGSIDIDGVEGSVKATSINGRVNARGLVNEVRLSTINGPLVATFTQLDEAKPISLGSVNGNVTLVIPSNANASIRAGTVHGGISSDFGLKIKHGEYVGHSLDGQIGNGGPRIKLANVNGGIKITHAEDGLPLSPGVSLQGEAAVRDAERAVEVDVTNAVAAAEAAHAARMRIDSGRIAREAQREAQRQVDIAMRESQREIEAAQRQIERERTRIEVRSKVIARNNVVYNTEKVTAKETRTFSVGNAPRITLSTFDGQVTVRGWDKNEVTYNATKGAADEEALKQISIQAQQQGDAISITTINPDEVNGRVNFDVYVPRQATLHVSSGDGALNLDGVTGQITLRSGDGPIDVANGGGQLQVNTGDGVIRVIKFEGQVDARTGDGAIALDGNFNAVSARTGDGEISLTVPAGSSFTIETNSMEDLGNEGFVINEDITPSPRVKRWKIGNGGKVFVLRTGDGKILLRPRQ